MLSLVTLNFLDVISIWIGWLNKAVCPFQCGWASSHRLRTSTDQKCRRRNLLLFPWLLELGHQSFPALSGSGSQVVRRIVESTSVVPLVLKPSSSKWIALPAFFGSPPLQMVNHGFQSLHNVSQFLKLNLFLCVSY